MDTNIYIGAAPSSNHAISPQRLSTDNWQSVVNGWTADSKAVIFESYRNGRWAIFRQAVGDKAAHALASGDEDYYDGALSSDGQSLLYSASKNRSEEGRAVRLMSVSLLGGGPSILLSGYYSYRCSSAALGICLLGENKADHLVLSLLDARRGKGKEVASVATKSRSNWDPSPDGTKVAVSNGENSIKIVTVATGKTDEIQPRQKYFFTDIAWSANGKTLFASGWSGTVANVLVSIDSSGGINVLKLERSGTEWFHALRVSPDGRYLAFTKRAFRSDLVLLENFRIEI